MPFNFEKTVHKQAANALSRLLNADANKSGGISIKSLTLAPFIQAKKATHALTCETLRYLPLLKELIHHVGIFESKKNVQEELVFVLVYDLLFGKSFSPTGVIEKLILKHKNSFKTALARILIKNKVQNPIDLLPQSRQNEHAIPRYVRVNTLRLSMEEAMAKLKNIVSPDKIVQDDIIPNLLLLPPETELHNCESVKNGSLILQGKSSCMAAFGLNPEPDWLVIDACAAPGNKTTHLSALMGRNGKIIACELNRKRFQILKRTISLADAQNVEILNEDFLKLDPSTEKLKNVKAILLDPSCSGSGTSMKQLRHLLPSYLSSAPIPSPSLSPCFAECNEEKDTQRLLKLSNFQKMMLTHAFKFQNAERILYSTCSIYEEENEQVIESVLPLARSHGFLLSKVIPSWPHRGNSSFHEYDKCLRTDATRDLTDGFFIALFTKDRSVASLHGKEENRKRGEGETEDVNAKEKKNDAQEEIEMIEDDSMEKKELGKVKRLKVMGSIRNREKKRKRKRNGK